MLLHESSGPVIHIVRDLRELSASSVNQSSTQEESLGANEFQQTNFVLDTERAPNLEAQLQADSFVSPTTQTLEHQPLESQNNEPVPESTTYDHLPSSVAEQAILLPCISALPHILEYGLEEFCDPTHFCLMWESILSHFFPASDGFTVSQGLPNDTASPYEAEAPIISLVCYHRPANGLYRMFDGFSSDERGQPLAVVRIFSPLDFPNTHLRDAALQHVQNQLNTLSPFNGYTSMMAIAAMGKAWRGLTKDVTCDSEGPNGSYAVDSEWMEDVTSAPSWDMLRAICDDIKRQTQTVETSRRRRSCRSFRNWNDVFPEW